MNNKTMNWKNALKLAMILSLFWSLVLLLGFLGFTDSISSWTEKDVKFTHALTHIVKQFISSTLWFFAFFGFQFFIFNKKWKFNKKLFASIVGCISFVVFIRVFVMFIFYIFSITPSGNAPNMFFILVFAIVITAMTVLLTSLFYIIGEREKAIVENQKLSNENIRARYETLKSRINPHFLFNSLNTLNGFIGIDNDKAKEYVLKLSSVFRYSVQSKEVTTLDDELVFTEAFCHLVKIRYGESLVIESRIDDRYRSCVIMPLSLQTLVENAIKHNTISNRYPLTITIETTDNATIRVSNKIQPKSEDTSGEGIGLANLTERYKMLYQKEVTISNANGMFSVEIPLSPPQSPQSPQRGQRGEEARSVIKIK